MTNLISGRIKTLADKLTFSDGTSVGSRASDVVINQNNIGFSIDITGIELKEAEALRQLVIAKIEKYENFDKVSIVLTSKKQNHKDDNYPKLHIDGVKKIIVIASGKGGVGKSTIATLLAHKINNDGKKVGIIDADIYGPSIPQMMSLHDKPHVEDKKMIPLENGGVYVNSIGFITAPGTSISWRGPMASKALYQLLSLTKWENLDYLIIDTPPGTGDIHLSLLQNYVVDKVIMVVTPQKVAELDVNRAINLYEKFHVPIFGIIENMSYYVDTNSKKKVKIFAGNAADKIAQDTNIPILTKIPIIPELSLACDEGKGLDRFTSLLNFEI
jgi:ATP-binding protein involved in chromosome partitioning